MEEKEIFKKKIKELENKVNILENQLKNNLKKREKIEIMSAEVTDSNPYRLLLLFIYIIFFKKVV